MSLSILTKGTPDEKLEWTFKLYDRDNNGYLSHAEMTKVMTGLIRTARRQREITEREAKSKHHERRYSEKEKKKKKDKIENDDSVQTAEEVISKLLKSVDNDEKDKLTFEQFKRAIRDNPTIFTHI